MELRQLAVFVAVAEELSFTRAAARLSVVQSAVSAAVRTLERELGAELLIRSTHHVALSDAGRVLLPEARATLAAAQEARHAVEQQRGGLRGTIHLGILQVLRDHPVSAARVIAALHARHPGIAVEPRQAGSAVMADDVRHGRLDAAYLALPSQQAGLTLHGLSEEPMVFVCPPDHPLAGRAALTLADVAGEPFVDTPEHWGTRIFSDLAYSAAGLAREIRYEIGDLGGVAAFVQSGLGVAILPPGMIDPVASVTTVPLTDAPLFRISLAVPAGRPTGAVTRRLVETALELRDRTPTPAG
ncbi:LysR family transcriptional regulator [Pseudonocardia sp. CA-107938]|uniref:LysR family transcriptional regulator n=1 Tax=Pseudonocardia sp. CA-107938 TaxID=3240021 RepID=UPI003D8DB37B